MSADATPIQTMEARRAEAMRTVKAREDGIRGNAFKQGRAAERAEQEVAISRLFATHQGEIQGISAAHVDEIARLDERLSIVERRLDQERSMTRWLMERVDQLVQFIRALGQEPPEPDTPCPTREMS